MDDLQRVVAVQGSEAKIIAMRSAYWLYERNPNLSLDEQSEGFAFLIAACLRITDAEVRRTCLHILKELNQSRPHQIGSQVDWVAFTHALPTFVASKEIHNALFLLSDANDAGYLSVLEDYFDHPDHYDQALSSWVALAYTEHYTFDERVLPYLRDAEKLIKDQFAPALARRRAEERASNQRTNTPAPEQRWRPLFPEAKTWAMQQFALADERMRQHLQVQDCRASQKEYEEQKLIRTTPTYLANVVQQNLAVPLSEKEYNSQMMRALDTFTYNTSFTIDEVAQTVKVLVDSALESEDHRQAWSPIAVAFDTRRYVGTYLDWDQLAAVLPSLDDDRNDPKFGALRSVLGCLSKAPEERFLDILQPYLDHPNHYVRADAADAIRQLLCHLAHSCPEVIFLARQIMKEDPSHSPKTFEAWQQVKERLARLAHDARPYFHYYSI